MIFTNIQNTILYNYNNYNCSPTEPNILRAFAKAVICNCLRALSKEPVLVNVLCAATIA